MERRRKVEARLALTIDHDSALFVRYQYGAYMIELTAGGPEGEWWRGYGYTKNIVDFGEALKLAATYPSHDGSRIDFDDDATLLVKSTDVETQDEHGRSTERFVEVSGLHFDSDSPLYIVQRFSPDAALSIGWSLVAVTHGKTPYRNKEVR
jgi:hypothetical protein